MGERDNDKRPERLVSGLVLMTLGAIFLLGRLDLLQFDALHTYWPMIVVAVGVGKFLSTRGRRPMGEGLWLIFIGFWLQANVSHWFGLSWRNSWPLMLVYVGLTIVIKEFFPRPRSSEADHGL